MIALMYHDLVSPEAPDASGFPGRDAALYKVTPDRFEAHLAAIGRVRPAIGDASDVVLTFDDGGASAIEAADALERHGRRGYFFVTANYIGAAGFLTAAAVRDLHRRGHRVGSHSCSHPLRMAHCPAKQILREWVVSRERLEDLIGSGVQTASVPGGDYADHVASAAADAGYTLLFTSEPTAATRGVGAVTVNGRYTVQRWTSAAAAAQLAAGAWLPRSRQALAWSAKKIGKRICGAGYLRARRLVLGSAHDVRWGDSGSGRA